MCEEVNARHAVQPGSGSIALYRRLRLGQWCLIFHRTVEDRG